MMQQNVRWYKKVLLHYHIHLTAFSRTTSVSRHQKGKPFWILLEQEMMGRQWHQTDPVHIICTSSRSRLITIPAPHHSVFTGRMLFLPPNQQRW